MPVSDPLSKYEGKRANFICVYDGELKTVKVNHKPVKLVLLLNLLDDELNLLRDHIWVRYNKDFKLLNLHKGDIIRFNAYVHCILKGYLGSSRRSFKSSKLRLDYILLSLTNIKKLI